MKEKDDDESKTESFHLIKYRQSERESMHKWQEK